MQEDPEMASLLFWWSTDGAPINDTIWRRMVAETAKGAGLEKRPGAWIEGANYRALGIKTLPLEPSSVVQHEDGDISLASLRFPLSGFEFKRAAHHDPAAIIHFSPGDQALTLTRDVLGQRPLVWCRVGKALLVASREESLLRHPEVLPDVDLFQLACYLASVPGKDDRTPFRRISAVAPGEQIIFQRNSQTTSRFIPRPDDDLRSRPARQLEDILRSRLDDTVARLTKGVSRTGLFLSAGMDSPSVAASLCSASTDGQRPFAVTFGAPEDTVDGFDERGPAALLAERLGMEHCTFEGRGFLAAPSTRPKHLPLVSLNYNRFHALYQHCRKLFRNANCDIALTGYGGDLPLIGRHHWIMSAWQQRDITQVFHGFRLTARRYGISQALWNPAIKHWLRYLLIGSSVHQRLRTPAALGQFSEEWQGFWRSKITTYSHWPDPSVAAHVFGQHVSQALIPAEGADNPCGVEFRHPFAEWPMLQFSLSVDSHHWTGPPEHKRLLRSAMRARLGDSWTERPRVGVLGAQIIGSNKDALSELQTCSGWNFAQMSQLQQSLRHIPIAHVRKATEWARSVQAFLEDI
jgi:asparagine synthetase B (glutamine-hydrolysing)